VIEALSAAILHAVVVSVLGAGALFVVVALTVRTVPLHARTRHAVWTIALCAAALMPLGIIGVSALRAQHVDVGGTGSPATAVGRASAANSRADGGPAPMRQQRSDSAASGALQRGALWLTDAARAAWHPRPGKLLAIMLAGIWLTGMFAGFLNVVLGLRRVAGLKARSLPLDAERAAELPWLTEGTFEREIYLRLSYEIETPVAVGFTRPVILLPHDLVTQAGLPAIEGLVLHEHAHLRRFDDWTNLMQRVIERVFWFNPLVWAVGRRIALEREIAADDAVVAATGQPAEYAQSLWRLAREMRMPEHSVVAPGAFFTRKQISIRIEALLDRRPVTGHWGRVAAAGVALTAVACSVAAAAGAPGIEFPATPATMSAFAAPSPAVGERAPAVGAGTDRSAVALPQIVRSLHTSIVRTAKASAGIAAAAQRVMAEQLAPVAPVARVAQCFPCTTSPHVHPAADSRALNGIDLSGHDLRNSDWRGRTFIGADLSGADLRGARFVGSDLSGARLDGATLTDVVMTGTNIEGASFHGAKTTGVRITGASLIGMDLRGLDLRSILVSCTGCDLEDANLANANLSGTRLIGMSFAGANLRGVDLHGAVLNGSNFDSADLTNANLENASLTGCDFDGTNLSGADTRGADFSGAMHAAAH
jgi:uncharacterized protein YjbI with pentapeptide repeats/beta-lactamase regulating signal transducer with metallopeptidase domain